MTVHERLTDCVSRYGPLCVGLDPRIENLPDSLRGLHSRPEAAIEAFCLKVLDLCGPYTGIIKPQAAFFEQYGALGMTVMGRVIQAARELGYFVILDAKRGDIASTAEAYAYAAFKSWQADSLTVNPYLGRDAVEPFIRVGRESDCGLFVLVRTSNAGSGLFQNLKCDSQPMYRHVAKAVVEWDEGKGDIGAVVGATHPTELAELRQAMPGVWFLIPGYGAQGGTADDVKAGYLPDGTGAIVNSSRGVTFPFKPDDPDWEGKIVAAAAAAQKELRKV